MELDLRSFHLPGTIEATLMLVRERAERHSISIGCTIDPGCDMIVADERKLKQILLNLLSNAVKFTPPGGKIGVEATRGADGVQIAVSDTGVGIAPEHHDAVFEEFRQVGKDYTSKTEGTGLGLTLAKKFVELHGGRITLASALGKGTTFTFNLPERQTNA